jgi:hypothetical protein
MQRNPLVVILFIAAFVALSHLISCGVPAQKKFNQAVWILHSFWYEEAVMTFTAVTEVEPDCAMGYWGIAMSHWYPLCYPPNAASLKAGSAAVEKAVAAKQKTDRESDYIAAIAAFYRDDDKVDQASTPRSSSASSSAPRGAGPGSRDADDRTGSSSRSAAAGRPYTRHRLRKSHGAGAPALSR